MNENYHELVVAICGQAMCDYYMWKYYEKHGFPKTCDMKDVDFWSAVEFIGSNTFLTIMKIDGEKAMEMLDQKIELGEPFKIIRSD